jgi:hypothetical protein
MKNSTEKNKPEKKRKRMRSFEAAPDVAEMLDKAADSGAVITEITNAALRLYGPDILREHVKKLRDKADAIEKSISEGKH